MQAWHGSHARFEAFSSEFIGSGRGDSPLGWGFYFTEDRGEAEDFARFAAKSKGTGFLYRVELQVSEHELIHVGNEDEAKSRKFLLSQYNSRRQSVSGEVHAKMLRFANCHAVIAEGQNGKATILCMSPERIAIKQVYAYSSCSPRWVPA